MTLNEGWEDRLSALFRGWKDEEGVTELYATLAQAIAGDRQMLSLYETIEPAKHRPVTLFAAVHYLVLRGTGHPLGRIYEVPEARGALEEAPEAFRSFCTERYDDIVRVMSDRTIQTNEVNRCSGLLPAFMKIHRDSGRELGLIEMGASAGLNLLFDRYRYDYGNGVIIGQPGAAVRCHTEIRGRSPILDTTTPPVEFRMGLDLDPVDINNENEVLWLRACTWAGDDLRSRRLTAALELARREWISVREGNAIDLVSDAVDSVPDHLEVVLFNSWMMGWLSEADRKRLSSVVASIGRERPLWWVTYEWPSKVPAFASEADKSNASLLGLQRVTSDGVEATALADLGHHGTWIHWRDEASLAQ